MKILKYILLFLLVLVLLFVGKGLITPSISYDCQVSVDKPIAEVWAVMSDEAIMPDWIEGFKKSEHISGTPGEVGAVSHITVEENGTAVVIKETITALRPNEHLAMEFSMDMMHMDYQINVGEEGGKTWISSTSETVGNGIFAKSMISFMPGVMKAQEAKNLAKLKEIIERNTKNYNPIPASTAEEATVE